MTPVAAWLILSAVISAGVLVGIYALFTDSMFLGLCSVAAILIGSATLAVDLVRKSRGRP